MRKTWLPDRGQKGKQYQFLHDLKDVFEVFNAGSVGSGKTDAGVMGAVYYRDYARDPAYCGLILRHDEKDLHKHILGLVERPGYYGRYAPGALNSSSLVYQMLAGGRVIFAHAKRMSGLHGPEFQYVWFDELPHWRGVGFEDLDPPEEYGFVITRMRSATGIPLRLRSGGNALGIGRNWVRHRFGPWLRHAKRYLRIEDKTPPHHRAMIKSLIRLIEQGHIQEPQDFSPLVPSATVLYYHPHSDGTETYEPPPEDAEDCLRRGLLSRSCLVTHTEDNLVLAKNDPLYSLRVRAAGATMYSKIGKNDWEVEDAGKEFFRSQFKVIHSRELPPLAGVLSRWDLAWSRHEKGGLKAERSPWSVRCKLGWTYTRPRMWIVLHVVRAQGSPSDIMALIRQTARADGPHVPVVLPVDFSSGKVVISDVQEMLEGYQVIEQRETGEKSVRIASLQAPAHAGRILLLEGEWNHAFLDEVERYPAMPVDQLDALAGARLQALKGLGVLPSDEEIEAASSNVAILAQGLTNVRSSKPAPSYRLPEYDQDEDEDGPFGVDSVYRV